MVKQNYRSLLLIFLFSLFIMVPTLNGIYISGHDTMFHAANISSIVEKINLSNILVREPLDNIAHNFGYGTRFFYPSLPHLLAAYITKFISYINISDVFYGMRITQWLTFFLSGISFYLLGIKVFKKGHTATLLSLFYMSFPYRLSDVFIRDAFSEMFMPISLPLITLGLVYLIRDDYKHFYFYFILGYTLAIYSHMAMSIYFTILIILTFFTVFYKKIFTKENISRLFKASIFILFLTSAFWAPLLENKILGDYGVFTPYYMTKKGDLIYSALNIIDLFRYDLGYGYNSIRFNIPIYLLILCIMSIYYIVKNKLWNKRIYIFMILFTLVSTFMVTKYFPWAHVPQFMETLQFPWRLVLYIGYGSVLVSGISISKLESNKNFKGIYISLIILAFLGSFYYQGFTNEDPVDTNNLQYQYGLGNQKEYLPIKTINNIEYYDNRKNDIKVESGKGNITIDSSDIPNMKFEVKNNNNLVIELPRIYYLGYTLKFNNKTIKLNESNYGFLEANIIEDGTYELIYTGTITMKVSQYISLITTVGLVCFLLKKKYNI